MLTVWPQIDSFRHPPASAAPSPAGRPTKGDCVRRTTALRVAVVVAAGAALTAVALPPANAQSLPAAAPAPADRAITAADTLVASPAMAATLHKGAGDTMVRQAVYPGPN